MAFVVAPAEIHRDLCTERGAGGCTCAEVSADQGSNPTSQVCSEGMSGNIYTAG